MKTQATRIREQQNILMRELSRTRAYSTLKNVTDAANYMLYDRLDGLSSGSIMTLDPMTTNVVGTTAIGIQTVTVLALGTAAAGQEMTMMDDVNLERPIIQSINVGAKQVTFTTPLTKAYKDQAQLCRSSMAEDTANKLLKFSGWSRLVTFTNTAVTVVASAYYTSGNGGKHLVQLSNGWLVSAASDVLQTNVYFYKSTDLGVTWTQLCWFPFSSIRAFAIVSVGNVVHIITSGNTPETVIGYTHFDASTQTNVSVAGISNPDTGQTSTGAGCSLAIDGSGNLHAAWVSKNATYPSAYNIRYSKSTDNGATWAAPIQITSSASSGLNYTNPSINTRSTNDPNIAFTDDTGVSHVSSYISSSWSSAGSLPIIFNSSSGAYTQSGSCLLVKRNGSNIGRMWYLWHGLDSIDTTKQNIRASYSDNSGAAWNTAFKVTSGNIIDRQNPTLFEDTSGNIFVIYMDGAGISYQTCLNGATTFGSVTTLNAVGANPSSLERGNFTIPPTLYMGSSNVLFNDAYLAQSSAPVLIEDVRFNIIPAAAIGGANVFVDHDTDINYSLAGALSIHATTESFTPMIQTSSIVDGNTTEERFVSSATPAAKATLRLTASRVSTAVSRNIEIVHGMANA